MDRKSANIYGDTRNLLDQIKNDFEFKSDDQLIRFLCQMFIEDNRSEVIKIYNQSKRKVVI